MPFDPSFGWVVVLLVLWILRRPLIALVAGAAIGKQVLAQQPDTIHLVPAPGPDPRHAATVDTHATTLLAGGFADAGAFTVPEMPELWLRLLAHESEGWLATVYVHRRAGCWLEVNARFPDDTRIAFINHPGTGIASLPGQTIRHMGGASAGQVLRTARASLAKQEMPALPIEARQAPRVFEEGYARLAALRKQQGISTAEVVAVSLRKPIANKPAA